MRVLLPLLALACSRTPQLGAVEHVDPNRSEVYGAGLLFSSTSADTTVHGASLIDGDGQARWQRDLPGQVERIRALADGTLLVVIDESNEAPGAVQREDLDGTVLQSIPAPDAHHDALELPDGRWVWLEHVEATVPFNGGEPAPVSTDQIMVAQPGGSPSVLFSFFDDYGVEPWFVCSHVTKGARIPGHHQWTHSNSLVLDPTQPDHLLVLSRNLDALLVLDWHDGRLIDQIGGRDGTVPLLDDAALDHPHMSQITDDGHILAFDNGLHGKTASRAVELEAGPNGFTLIGSIAHPTGETIGYLGDVRRLPGGNTLVAWSSDARIMEYTPEGDVVWDLQLLDTKHVGRVSLWTSPLP